MNDIKIINFHRKSRQYYVSKLDLGEEAFKNELFKRKMITPEEYIKYTTNESSNNQKLFKSLIKIEII